VASPDSEQQEQPPPRRPAERPRERASVASQMLPTPPPVPLPPPVAEPPTSPAPSAHAPAAPSPYPPTHAPVWQRQPPILVPLPSLEDETEGGELAAARRVRRSVFSRTFGFILLLALGAGTWFYHEEVGYGLIWLGQQLAGVEQDSTQQNKADATLPSTTVPAQPVQTPAAATGAPKPSAKTPSEAQVKKPEPPATTTEPAVQEPAASTTKEEKDLATPPAASANSPAATEAAPDAGQAEYSEALRILGGDEARTRMPDAVRLLWVYVEKGNSNAEVTLADLYREGRGVKKNCEQTRVLLSAAARKGNALAQRSLQQFIRDGCEQ
jgi:hypothetical protein